MAYTVTENNWNSTVVIDGGTGHDVVVIGSAGGSGFTLQTGTAAPSGSYASPQIYIQDPGAPAQATAWFYSPENDAWTQLVYIP